MTDAPDRDQCPLQRGRPGPAYDRRSSLYEMFQLGNVFKGLPRPTSLYEGSKYKINKEKAQASAACSKFMSMGNGAACACSVFIG